MSEQLTLGTTATNQEINFLPQMETVKVCPLCRSEKATALFWNFDRRFHLPGKFKLIGCDNCQLIRLSPRPVSKDIGFYYPEDKYYSYHCSPEYGESSPGRTSSTLKTGIRESVLASLGYQTKNLKRWQRLLQPLFKKFFFGQATHGWRTKFPHFREQGRALDVGCGNASFLALLKHYGWEVNGVDISQAAAEQAKIKFGIDVFVGSVIEAPFELNAFDYIHLGHVLEHLPNPLESLQKLKEILKPNGTLCIQVPNVSSYSCKVSKEHWYAWDTPRHLLMFSPETLQALVEAAGFKILKMDTWVVDDFAWDAKYRNEDKNKSDASYKQFSLFDKLNFLTLHYRNVINHSFNKMDGDVLNCWATKY